MLWLALFCLSSMQERCLADAVAHAYGSQSISSERGKDGNEKGSPTKEYEHERYIDEQFCISIRHCYVLEKFRHKEPNTQGIGNGAELEFPCFWLC